MPDQGEKKKPKISAIEQLRLRVMKHEIAISLLTNQLRSMPNFPVMVLDTVDKILASKDDSE